MPNYVTHRIVVTGPQETLAAIRERHFGPIKGRDGEDRDFMWDFRTIIPMPPELEAIKSDGVSGIDHILVECLTGKPYPEDTFEGGVFRKKTRLTPMADIRCQLGGWSEKFRTVETPDQVVSIFEKMEPRCVDHFEGTLARDIDVARQRVRAIAACGYGDTLEWCTKNWGTKWGSFRCGFDVIGDGMFEFHFETAWSPPAPIFRAFAAMYPHIQFSGNAFDEGWNFEAKIVGFNGNAAVERTTATKETYAYVYGRPYEEEEEYEDA